MIGLAKKAGRVEIGEEPVGSAARSKHARVILVASDAAASSVRRAYAFAQTGACLCLTIPADKDTLGRARLPRSRRSRCRSRPVRRRRKSPGVRPVRAAGAPLLRSSGLPVPGR